MMEYRGYLGKVDVDGDQLYGTVVNLHRDHVDFRGATVDEVRQAFHNSVDFYLDGCKKDGEEPEKPFSGNSSFASPQRLTGGPAHLPASRTGA